MSKDNARNIGCIGNYYGGLAVKEEDGKFYWSIENWDGHDWDECPEYLFKALNQHQDELESQPVNTPEPARTGFTACD